MPNNMLALLGGTGEAGPLQWVEHTQPVWKGPMGPMKKA